MTAIRAAPLALAACLAAAAAGYGEEQIFMLLRDAADWGMPEDALRPVTLTLKFDGTDWHIRNTQP